MYGSEMWVPTKKVQTRIQSNEMNFLRKTKGCTKLGHTTKEIIRTEINIYPVNDTIRNNWLQKKIECNTHEYQKEHFSTDLQERMLRKTKEKMARCSVKTEQAKCLIHGVKKKKIS
jgi:hypothetical protein